MHRQRGEDRTRLHGAPEAVRAAIRAVPPQEGHLDRGRTQ
jgi:hypothetical protein